MNLKDRMNTNIPSEDPTEASEPTSQISILKSKISELQSNHQSEIAELEDELSDMQKLNQSLANNNRLLTQSNDDLRNNNGLMLREEQKKLKEELDTVKAQAAKDLDDYNRKLQAMQLDCSNKISSANRRAQVTESRCENDNKAAAEAKRAAEEHLARLQLLLKNEESRINELADEKIKGIKAFLYSEKEKLMRQLKADRTAASKIAQTKYAGLYAAREICHGVVFGYCTLWLIIQALFSDRFKAAILELYSWVKLYFTKAWATILSWSGSAANITKHISNETGAAILYWFITVIVWILLFVIGIVAPLSAVLGGSYVYVRSKRFDSINRWFMVCTGIIFIAASSETHFRFPLNLILLWIILQVVFPLLRSFIARRKKK